MLDTIVFLARSINVPHVLFVLVLALIPSISTIFISIVSDSGLVLVLAYLSFFLNVIGTASLFNVITTEQPNNVKNSDIDISVGVFTTAAAIYGLSTVVLLAITIILMLV